MALSIQLLGPPRLERGGVAVEPARGHKGWGLLAYLIRSRIPPSRQRLAELLFPEAEDPLRALRWTLSALRRQLGADAELEGDPLRLTLSPGTFVDLEVLSRGSWSEAIALPGIGHELLDGLTFRASPGFELWLEGERRHVLGTTSAVLHEAALAQLARGEVADATRHAAELVRLNPFDENAHVLLVRCLCAAGDRAAARRHVEACTAHFGRELGTQPSPALRTAIAVSHPPVATRVPGPATVRAQLEAGEAALAAGAVQAGLERVRAAVVAARSVGDPELLAASLVTLGGALVHSARGTDEEGAAALHEGTVLAEQVGRHDIAATGWREIAWVQFLRAHYERAEESLVKTAEFAAGNLEELAWVDLIRGACRHDMGDYAGGERLLRAALARSRELDAGQPLGQALTLLGRLHLLRGEHDAAGELLDEALAEVAKRGMTAFRPWPESFRGELDLMMGDIGAAAARFEHAFALGTEVGDPCWESIALRGLGLVAAARGDFARGLELLVEAPKLCRRLPDTYLWIEAYGLDALCSVAVEHGAAAAPRWIDELEAITARRGVRELRLRATAYRARLGQPGALEAAQSLAGQIDNPAIGELLATRAGIG